MEKDLHTRLLIQAEATAEQDDRAIRIEHARSVFNDIFKHFYQFDEVKQERRL